MRSFTIFVCLLYSFPFFFLISWLLHFNFDISIITLTHRDKSVSNKQTRLRYSSQIENNYFRFSFAIIIIIANCTFGNLYQANRVYKCRSFGKWRVNDRRSYCVKEIIHFRFSSYVIAHFQFLMRIDIMKTESGKRRRNRLERRKKT